MKHLSIFRLKKKSSPQKRQKRLKLQKNLKIKV